MTLRHSTSFVPTSVTRPEKPNIPSQLGSHKRFDSLNLSLPKVELQFGLALADYTDIFSHREGFNQYGGCDPEKSESLYSEETRKYYDTKVTELATPEVTQKYLDSDKLGVLEEAGDILFEYALLNALKRGLIDDALVKQTVTHILNPVLEAPREERPAFDQTLIEILELVPKQDKSMFVNMIGDFNPEKAERLLALFIFKLAIFKRADDTYDYEAVTRRNVLSEAEELYERLDGLHPSGKRMKKTVEFADRINLPYKALTLYPRALVNLFHKKNFTARELLKFAYIKQLGRQQFNYFYTDQTYNERKSHYKFREAILEAGFLRRKGVPTD